MAVPRVALLLAQPHRGLVLGADRRAIGQRLPLLRLRRGCKAAPVEQVAELIGGHVGRGDGDLAAAMLDRGREGDAGRSWLGGRLARGLGGARGGR